MRFCRPMRDLAEKGAAIVSVAAGIRIERFETAFGDETAVIRVMPNTPAAVGAGMMVLCANEATSGGQLDFARTLMSASGETAVIEDEALMDAVTAVSGSGPAYLFHMIEALTDAAKRAGLPDDLAGDTGQPDDLRGGGLLEEKRRRTRHAARTGHQPERHDGGGAVPC
jgi:pyrroline-5-carboxylate reductase